MNQVDKGLLDRVIQAPWLSQRQQQSPSALLKRNAYAIGFLTDRSCDPPFWSKENAEILQGSGLQDYLMWYKDINPSPNDFIAHLVVIDGKMYSVVRGDLISLYTIKFYKIPGTIPFVFSKTGIGYDLMLPITTTVEKLSSVIWERWSDLFDRTDFSKLMGPRPTVEAYIKKSGLDEYIKDPLVQQAVGLLHQDIQEYEVMMELYVITDHISGIQTVAMFPMNIYGRAGDAFSHIARQILPKRNSNNPNEDISELVIILFNMYEGDPEETQKRVKQYEMPEVQPGEGKVVFEISEHLGLSLQSDVSRTDYFDFLACLSSRGLLSSLIESGRKDYLKFFAEHVDPSMPYVRYALQCFDSDGEANLDLDRYQRDYNYAAEIHNENSKNQPHFQLAEEDDKYQLTLPLYEERAANIIKKRILDAVSQFWNMSPPLDIEIDLYYRGIRSTIPGINEEVGLVPLDQYDRGFIDRGLPSPKRMLDYLNKLVKDYEEVEIIRPVEPASQYITIHGVTFRSYEIVRLFHGTPIASAAALGSEYDPNFMTHNDVRITADLLNGRIMLYTFYLELSDKAYIALSDEGSFLYLYSYGCELDDGFVLGERFINYVTRFKREKGNTVYLNKAKTLLELF